MHSIGRHFFVIFNLNQGMFPVDFKCISFCFLLLHDSYASLLAVSIGFCDVSREIMLLLFLVKKSASSGRNGCNGQESSATGVNGFTEPFTINPLSIHRSKRCPYCCLTTTMQKFTIGRDFIVEVKHRSFHLDRCPTVRIHKLWSIDAVKQFIDYHLRIMGQEIVALCWQIQV